MKNWTEVDEMLLRSEVIDSYLAGVGYAQNETGSVDLETADELLNGKFCDTFLQEF